MHFGGAPNVGHLLVHTLPLLFFVGAVADVTDELGQSPHRHFGRWRVCSTATSLLWFALNVHSRQKALAFKTAQPSIKKQTRKLSNFSSDEGKDFQKPPQKPKARPFLSFD
jgi:hypothetical protein